MSARTRKRRAKADMPANETKPKTRASRWYAIWAPLVMTAAVVGLTVFLALREPRPPSRPSDNDGSSLARKVLAQVEGLMELGQYESVVSLAQAYVRSHPGDIEVRPLLAEAQLELRRADQAELTIDELLALAPHSPEALWSKGELVRDRGGSGYADYFRKAADSIEGAGPDILARYAQELLARGRMDEAERYFLRAQSAGARDARVLGGLGTIALQRKQYDRAEGFLAEAVESDRENPHLWVLLSEAQMESGKLDLSAATVAEAMNACRRKRDLWMMLGTIRLRQKRTAEAAEALAEAARYPVVRGRAALGAARCYYDLGEYALAMKYIDLAAVEGIDTPEFADLLEQIEDARFGPVTPPRSTSEPRPEGSGR